LKLSKLVIGLNQEVSKVGLIIRKINPKAARRKNEVECNFSYMA
jgi:hypothetical protein